MTTILMFVACLATAPAECEYLIPEGLPERMTPQQCALIGRAWLRANRHDFVRVDGERWVLRRWLCTPGGDA